MEVFPPDEAQPNDVDSGPTVPHEHMKDWDGNFASLEIALQNPGESKDGRSDGDNSKEKELPFMKESHVKNEGKRKWDDEIDDSQHKLKRMNDILLGTGDVTIHLVNSKDEKSDSIPVSNLLTIMKSESKPDPEELKYITSDKVTSQLGSLDFNKAQIKKENELDIKDLKDLTVQIKPPQVKSEPLLDGDKSYLADTKDFTIDNNFPADERKHSISENKFIPDNKNFPSDSEMTVSKDIKSDSGFTDDLSTESKADLFSPDDDMMYDIKNSDDLGDFKSEIDSECALSSNISRPHSDSGAGLPVEETDNQACDNSNLNEAEESSENKKDKKDESGDKNSKKDDKLSKKKKFERCNIRDIKLEDELDAVTLSAQKEEQERIRRLQEAQMRALQERLQQIEVEKEALTQLFSQPPDDGSNIFDSSISDSEAAKSSNKTSIKTESDVVLLESSDDDKKANLQTIPPPVEENIIDISSSSSGNESDSEDSDKKDDDVMVLSDEGETEEGTAEDPNNSGAHTNDCFNLLDEEGRVLVNVGHPPEDPDIFLAPQIAKVIKPHQIGGIRFLYDNVVENIERYKSSSGFGCILAHSMGLGKTVQVVSFVDVFLRHIPAKLVLCIVPINTIQNWKAEFDMWVPAKSCVDEAQSSEEIRPRTYHVFTLNENFKTMAARATLIAEWRKLGGVLLMGYEMYRMLALRKMPKIPLKKSKRLKKQELVEPETNEQIKKYMDEMYEHIVIPGPDLVICDEGHRIKNSLASTSMALKSIKTRRRVVLTGYPLQNNLLEYWCMVDFVRPNYLGSRAEFCNMFERPISNGQCIDSTPRDRQLMRFRSHVLHSLLVGFVQRRGHSVLRAVLPKKEEHVLLIRMTPIQRQLYKCFVKDLLYVQQATNPLKLFAVCCKIWNHPDILYKLLQEKKAQEDIDLDIDIATNSGLSGPGGKKRAISQAKSKVMQRPLRALPRSLKPQPSLPNSVEGTIKQENIKCEPEASSNTDVACKEEFSYGQTNVTDQKDFLDSQSYQSQYSKSNTNQQACQQSYPSGSGQFNASPSTQYPSSNNNSPGSSQTPYSSQTSVQSSSQYPHSMQQYSQSSNQYSQYGGQSNPQEESSSHPSSPSQTSFQAKPSQPFAPQSNSLPYSQPTDQYPQKSGQTLFPKQSSGQEMNFPQSPSSKFSSQTSQQFSQSFNSQNSSQYSQSYPPTSKQHQFSEQTQSLQFSSPMSENMSSSHSTSQSYSNPQSHISEQTSPHFQPTHFSQKQSTQQFSQPPTSSSSQFSSSDGFPHISSSDHFPQQSSSHQPSTPSQPSSTQQGFTDMYPQPTSEFSSSQHFVQQSFSEQTSPNQAHYSHQGYSQQYLPSNDQTSQQFPQQGFSSHQPYSNQSTEGSKYGTKQPSTFPPQSPSNLQFSTSSQKQGSNSSEEGNQNFNQPTFPSHKTSESQYSQASGSSHPFGSPPSQNSQTTNQFSPHEVTSSDQYIQISSNTQYNQSIDSTQSYNQPSSQQFSGCGNQVSIQFNQPQSSQQFGQLLNSPQYSQPAINSCFPQQPMPTQQFSSSSKGKQYPQSTQGQTFSQPTKPHFSQSSPTQKSYPQQISSQSCSQQPQFSQPQQYSLQSPQQYNQTQPPHSPQQFTEKSPQQYNQPSSSQSSQLFMGHQQFSQQAAQSSQDFNQPTAEPFNKQISQPYNSRQTTEQFNQLPGQSPLNQSNQTQQYSPQQNQSSQMFKHQGNASSQGYKQPSPPQFNPSQYSQKQLQNSQQFTQQFSQPVQSPQQYSQQPSPQQFSQQPSPQQFSQPAQSPQQYSQPSPQQFTQQTSPSPQQFSQTSSPHQYASQPSQQFPQQPSPQQYTQPSQTQQSFPQQVSSSQQSNSSLQQFSQQPSPQQFPPPSQSQTFSQPTNTSPQQYTQQTNTSPQQYTQPTNTSPQQYTQQTNASPQYGQQANASSQQFIQQTNASAQQFNQQANASSQQFNQQTSTQQFNRSPNAGNQQFNPQTNAPTQQQFNQQTKASTQQYTQQTNASTQQFNQQLQSFSHSTNSQQFSQQSCQQFSQSYSQNNTPQPFLQQPSPQQFTQPPQSQQGFNQANTSQQLSPQHFTKPSQSQQSFNPQTNPQQFSQQLSPQQVQQSQQSFSQQKGPAQEGSNQSSAQGSQPSQQFKHQNLHSSQFPNPQVFSGSFPQSSNADALKETFQGEYSNPNQSSVTNQGLASTSLNQQASKFPVRGAKAKQARGKSMCQNLPATSAKQAPFSVQSFQNGSPNPTQVAMGQQGMKQLQNNPAFQPNPSMTHDNYSLQPTKQESGMFTAKCSKPLMGKPDSTNTLPKPIKPEQLQAENDQNTAETTVMPFRDKIDSSISYEWAIPLMKEYVLGVLENSHKMMVLFVIIAETLRMGDKLLVFSQSLSTLDLLEHFLGKIQVPTKTEQLDAFPTEFWCRNKNYFRLDGSTSAQEREKLINEFNRNENVSLFLLSTRAGCLGINLVGANRIVVMDASWNPCHDAQAVCRIYRYGQKKQCHIYRLVTDNSLEKRIYDRQVNKQGMSDRVVDELNPESNFTWKDVTTLIQDDEDDGPVQELSKFSSSYTDKVLKYLVSEMSPSLSKEPFEHESLLLDRKDLKLTKQEKRLAKQSYEMAKRANMINIRATYTYLPAGTPGGGQIIINNKQCQWVGGTTIRVLPNQTPTTGSNVRAGTTATPITASPSLMSSLFKQGVMVQKLTMPSNVSIPVLTPGAPPVVIPAGQDVLVLRTPKGVYLRLPDGRIIAVQLPPSLLAKTQFRPNVVTHFRPTAPKGGNQPTTVISTPRGQSIGIIKQTLQCGGTVRYGGSRGAAGSTASNSTRCAAPEVIDLSDDDEPSLRKSGTASNASTNSSESDTGSLDQDKLDSMQPVKFPGKQITIRKISPSSPQNSSGSNSKEKCEIPQVLSKNKQITIMPINPTSQQNRQKIAPQLAQPVRVQQMLLQPQQGKRRPIQKLSKVPLSPIVTGKNIRPQITITQPNVSQQSQSVRPVATHNQQKEELLDNAGDSDTPSVAKQSEDSSSLNTEVSSSLNSQNVPQALQNSKNISISLSESPKTSTLPDSLASLTNKLNPNLQISPVEHFPVSQANTLTSGLKSVTPDLLPQKNIFHQNTSLQAVSSSSFQSQNVQSSHPVCKSPQLSNKSDSSVQQLNATQSVYNLKPTPQAQTHFPASQTSSSASSGSTLEQSFQQHAGISHTNTPQMQPKIHSEQFTSLGHSRHNPRQSGVAPRNQPAPRKRKSTSKLPPKKSPLEPSVVTQGHPLVPDATQQFRHPENHFSNFPHPLASSDFQVFPTFSSQKPVPQIQHPQPLLPLQHSQEHNAHLQHMSHIYPMPSHIPSAPSSLSDMQAPRAWLQPSVSSFLPFSQSSSMYSQENSQFSFPPSFPPSSVASNASQSESNVNSGSGENKASHLSSSDL